MNKEQKEQLETLAVRIEAKRQSNASSENLTIIGWAGVDSYNKALTEAAELVRAEIKKDI